MFSELGTAQARFIIDMTQVDQSVQLATKAAEDIRRVFDQMAQGMASSVNLSIQLSQAQAQAVQQSSNQIVQATRAAQEAVSESTQSQSDAMRNQIRVIDAVLSEMNAKLSAQQEQVRRTGASAFDKSSIQNQLNEYKDAVTESSVRLKELKADFANFLSDPMAGGDPGKGLERLNDIVASYRQWFTQLGDEVEAFKTKMASSASSVMGVATDASKISVSPEAQAAVSLDTQRQAAIQQQVQAQANADRQFEEGMIARRDAAIAADQAVIEGIQRTMAEAQAASDKYVQEKAKEAQAAITAREREAQAQAQADERELADIQKRMDAVTAMSERYIQEKAQEAQAALAAREREADADRQAQAASFEQEIQNQAKLNAAIAAAIEKRKQEEAAAVQEGISGEVSQIQAALSVAQKNLAVEQNRFQQTNIGVSGVDTTEVQKQFEAAKQPILELQDQLAQLKLRVAEALTPTDKGLLVPEFEKITQAAKDLAQNGMAPVTQAIDNFAVAAEEAQTGMNGFFNRLRENLEALNETSLVANIQELSFRLAPLGFAAGAATKQGVDTAQQIQEMTLSFNSFTGSQKVSVELMDDLIAKASQFGLPMTEVLTTMQKFAPTIREAGGNLNQVMDLAARIMTLNPGAGFTTAVEAITKGLGGTDRSLLTQFHILPDTIKEAEKQAGSFAGGLDLVLNKMGRTVELAQTYGDTNRSAMTRFGDAVNRFLSTAMDPFLNSMTTLADKGAEAFNALSTHGSNALTVIVGGVLSATSALSGMLITIGQVGLAYQGLSALAKSGLGVAIAEQLGGAIPAAVVTGVTSALSAVAGVLATTIAGAFAVAGPAIVAAIGTALGIGIVAGVQTAKGENGGDFGANVTDQFNKLKEIIFTAVDAVSGPLYIFAQVIEDAIQAIGPALDYLATSIIKSANDFLTSLDTAMANFLSSHNLPGADQFQSSADQRTRDTQSRFVDQNGNVIPAAGMRTGSPDEVAKFADIISKTGYFNPTTQKTENTDNWKFIEGYSEHLGVIQDKMQQLFDPAGIVNAGLTAAKSAMQDFLSTFMNIPKPGATVPGGIIPNSPIADGITGVLKKIGDAAQPFIDSFKDLPKILEQVNGAVLEFDITARRTQEDRAIQAQRAEQDFTIQRTNAITDFNQQLLQSDADYYEQRQKKIEDFNAQQQKAEADNNAQKAKQQDKFNQDEARRQADFVVQMKRLARDIDDAISARDFLTAQKDLQKQADQVADNNTETARRKQDFAQQLHDLDENLKKQETDKKADFDKQLIDADKQHDTQRQRQIAAFNLQLSREDAQRALTQQRQQADYDLADLRRQQDFTRQILGLIAHNTLLNTLFQQGLDGLIQSARNFNSQISGLTGASGGGQAVVGTTPYGPPAPSGTTTNPWLAQNGAVGGAGNTAGLPPDVAAALAGLYKSYPHAATGFGNLADDMLIQAHHKEIMITPNFSDAIRNGDLALSGPGFGGGKAPITVNLAVSIDARGQDMDPEALATVIEDKVVKNLTEKLEALQ